MAAGVHTAEQVCTIHVLLLRWLSLMERSAETQLWALGEGTWTRTLWQVAATLSAACPRPTKHGARVKSTSSEDPTPSAAAHTLSYCMEQSAVLLQACLWACRSCPLAAGSALSSHAAILCDQGHCLTPPWQRCSSCRGLGQGRRRRIEARLLTED